MTATEVRVRAEQLAEALVEGDPHAVRAAVHRLTPRQANIVARMAAALLAVKASD